MTRGRSAFRIPVEDSLRLDLAEPATRAAMPPDCIASGTWSWSLQDRVTAQIGYAWTPPGAPGGPAFTLRYARGGEPITQYVRLVTSRPNYGGVRWWFVCPLLEARGVVRRVRALYLPPGAKRWGSRHAYGLTYQSQRDCGLERALVRSLARNGSEHGGDGREQCTQATALDQIAALKADAWFEDRWRARKRRNAVRRIARGQLRRD